MRTRVLAGWGFLLATMACAAALAAPREAALATCTGADPCRACTNCKYCKRCAKNGGTCGVCRGLHHREGAEHEER